MRMDMLPIFICEDNRIQRERLKKYVEDFIMLEHFDMEIVFSSGDPYEVLEEIEKSSGMGLYFLDIDLQQPDLNGFELAKKIREKDSRGFIIFITTHAELTYLTFTYKVEALDYIIKDNLNEVQERVHDCLRSVRQRMLDERDPDKYFTFRLNDKKVIHEKQDDILFFETSTKSHKVVLHGKNRQIEFYAKMRDVEKILDEPFYRCHRSFLVNKNNINVVDRATGELTMTNGEICMASSKLIRGMKL